MNSLTLRPCKLVHRILEVPEIARRALTQLLALETGPISGQSVNAGTHRESPTLGSGTAGLRLITYSATCFLESNSILQRQSLIETISITRSNPIAIERPWRQSDAVHTLPEPLSARGDLPG